MQEDCLAVYVSARSACKSCIQRAICLVPCGGTRMTIEGAIARFFRMDDRTRHRHANPWSVYTRFTMIPLLGLAVWSRVWLQWWSLVPILAAVLWIWLNPPIFPEPKSTRNWASKVVLGEWIWMKRDVIPALVHQRLLPHVLSVASGIGFVLFLIGLLLLGALLAILGGCYRVHGKAVVCRSHGPTLRGDERCHTGI